MNSVVESNKKNASAAAQAPWTVTVRTMADLGLIPPKSPGADFQIRAGSRPLTAAEGLVHINPLYVWRKELLSHLAGFWNKGSRAAMMIGPTGSGKTTAVEQWHARLHWPLYSVTGHKRFQMEELVGTPVPTEAGGFVWQDGPLLKAARAGHSFLFNEINACPPDVTISMNDLCQVGSVITIPFTGERVLPAPGFRVWATKNPEGTIYAGRNAMDTSTRHRFKNFLVDFAEEQEEIQILVNVLTSCGFTEQKSKDAAAGMVKLARAVRPRSQEVSQAPDAIPEVISTRILCSWAEEWAINARKPGAVHRGMRVALTNGSDPISAKAIHDMIELIFGVDESGEESKRPGA